MTLQETIIACVRLILGDPSFDVRWYDKRSAWVSDTGHVEIVQLTTPRFGVDEQRLEPIGQDGATLQETIYGNRQLRLQFTCNTNDQDLDESGPELAESLVAGFSRHDVEELLAAVHVGVPRSQGTRVVNAPDAHGDERSIGVVELWFPWSRSQEGGKIKSIATVHYTGAVDEIEITGEVQESP